MPAIHRQRRQGSLISIINTEGVYEHGPGGQLLAMYMLLIVQIYIHVGRSSHAHALCHPRR